MSDYEKFQQWLNDCPVKIIDYQDFSDQFQITFEVKLEEESIDNSVTTYSLNVDESITFPCSSE
mgnify:FL=1